MSYRILILPNIAAIPLESLRQIEAYAKQGGIVVALERVPNASCGMKDWQANDQQVRDITARMFKKSSGRDGMGIEGPSSKVAYGSGTTYWVDRVMDRSNDLDKQSSVFDPFLRIIRSHVAPDLSINFVAEALRSNDGLCFTHRQDQDRDIYFVANVQDRAVDMPIGFRVSGAAPSEWDPYTGAVNTLLEYIESERETVLPVRLAPYESTFFIFEHGAKRTHATSSTLSWIEQLNETEAIGYTNRAGAHFVKTETGKTLRKRTVQVPAPYHINAQWNLQLKSPTFSNFEKMLNDLISWTDMTETKHFSGTGIYRTDFEMPTEYIQPDIRLMLDLGNVGNVAEVFLNGSRVGTVWMRGQQLDLSKNARVNTNQIEICVTNTLINRVSALSEFPPVPKELQARLGRGLHDEDSPAYSLLGFTPLPRSGLLGPLTVTPYKRVELN